LREKDFSIEIKTIGNSRTKEIGDKEKNKEDKEKTIARLAIQRFAARELKAQLHPRLLPIYISLLFSSPTLLLFTTFYFLLGFVTGLFFHISFLTVSIRGLSFFLFRAIKIQQLSRICPQWRRYALPWRAA
jgi:hypothetical protein